MYKLELLFKFASKIFIKMIKSNSVYYYLIAFILVGFVTSCVYSTHQEQDNGENEIEFELVEMNKIYNLENKEDYPSCNLEIGVQFPIASGKFELEQIQNIFQTSLLGSDYSNLIFKDALEKYALNYIESYKKDAEVYKTYRPKVEEENSFYEDEEHTNMPDIFYSYFESITNKVVYNKFGVLSFQVVQTNSKGGNISHDNVRNYVIDLNAGKLLIEGDIFIAGYDIALQPIIQNSLLMQHNVKSIEDLEDLGYFGVEEIIPNKNLLITNEGVIYTYNKGEFSAYQLPASEILIPYSHIRSILKEGSIAHKLSNL